MTKITDKDSGAPGPFHIEVGATTQPLKRPLDDGGTYVGPAIGFRYDFWDGKVGEAPLVLSALVRGDAALTSDVEQHPGYGFDRTDWASRYRTQVGVQASLKLPRTPFVVESSVAPVVDVEEQGLVWTFPEGQPYGASQQHIAGGFATRLGVGFEYEWFGASIGAELAQTWRAVTIASAEGADETSAEAGGPSSTDLRPYATLSASF